MTRREGGGLMKNPAERGGAGAATSETASIARPAPDIEPLQVQRLRKLKALRDLQALYGIPVKPGSAHREVRDALRPVRRWRAER